MIYGTIYDTIFLTIHQKGGHQKGAGAFGARPFLVESVVVDGEKYGVIYGAIYPTSYGTNYMFVQHTFVQVWAAPIYSGTPAQSLKSYFFDRNKSENQIETNRTQIETQIQKQQWCSHRVKNVLRYQYEFPQSDLVF